MPVFKTYFRILYRKLPGLMIYIGVFLFMATILTAVMVSDSPTSFAVNRVRTAILQNDSQDPFSVRFAAWLASQSKTIDLSDDRRVLQDAMFYGDVDYIIRIPAGFGDDFRRDAARAVLDRTKIGLSASSVQMDLLIQRYMALAQMNLRAAPNLSADELADRTEAALQSSADVQLITSAASSSPDRVLYYFRFLAYTITSLMILGVSYGLVVFNRPDLRRRNLASPLQPLHYSMQLFASQLVYALLIWFALTILALLLGAYRLAPPTLALLMLNMLVYSLSILAMSNFVNQFVHKESLQDAVTNIISLVLSFAGGIFVPQQLLGDTLLRFSQFLPTFWYAKAVDEIGALPDFSWTRLRPIGNYFLIQLGFLVVFVLLTQAALRYRRQAAA